MSSPLDLRVAKGADVTFAGTHQVSETDPTPVDITGWTIVVTAKTKTGTLVWTKTSSVTNGPMGAYSWSLAYADTNRAAEILKLDIFRTDPGAHLEMGIGTCMITPDVLYGS